MVILYYKSTCRTARKLLQSLGASVDEREMSKQPRTAEEPRALIGEREIAPYLNPRNEQYREQKMKQNPPSRDQAIALLRSLITSKDCSR